MAVGVVRVVLRIAVGREDSQYISFCAGTLNGVFSLAHEGYEFFFDLIRRVWGMKSGLHVLDYFLTNRAGGVGKECCKRPEFSCVRLLCRESVERGVPEQ